MVQSHSENRSVFRCLQTAAKESANLIFLWWGTQSLGAELEKPLKPNWCFFRVFFRSTCHTLIAFVHQGHDFVISSLSHWQPVQFFQDRKGSVPVFISERCVPLAI